MLKQKIVFNYATGRYNMPVAFNEDEKKILRENMKSFNDCRAQYINIIKNDIVDKEIIRKHNEKLETCTKALASIYVYMNNNPYFIK